MGRGWWLCPGLGGEQVHGHRHGRCGYKFRWRSYRVCRMRWRWHGGRGICHRCVRVGIGVQ